MSGNQRPIANPATPSPVVHVNSGGGVNWWAVPAVTLVVGIVTVAGQWFNHRSEMDAKMLQIGVDILKAEPKKETTNLRLWATELVNKHSDVPLSAAARNELQITPLPAITISSWPEAASADFCDQWQHNADGSWTQLGTFVLPGNIRITDNTFRNTTEAKMLDERCGQKK